MSSQSLPLRDHKSFNISLGPRSITKFSKFYFQSLIISNLSFVVDNILQANSAGSVQIIEELLVEDKRNSYNKSIIDSIN